MHLREINKYEDLQLKGSLIYEILREFDIFFKFLSIDHHHNLSGNHASSLKIPA